MLVLLLAPVFLAAIWRYTRRPEGLDAGEVQPQALSALRVCAWGAALWWAARVGPAGRPGFDLAANIGVGSAVVAANVALARIPHRQGLIKPPISARALDAALFCALLWGIASALPAGRALLPGSHWLSDPLATDYASSAASIASLLVLMASALRLRVTRRLELGVADRVAGALTLALTAFSIAVPAAVANLAAPDRVLPLGALAGALACTWTASAREPTQVSSALRGALVVMILGVPVALVTGTLAQRAPQVAGLVACSGVVAAIVVGLMAHALARPFAPEQSRWLGALEAASRACLVPEPNAAIVAALERLQGLEQNARTRPELWRVDPPEVLSVDVAGYLHTESGVVPPEVYQLAASEPESMLRSDVLTRLQVRRPEVRPVLGWLEARDAFSVTLVYDDQTPIGVLLLPRGSRTRPITLEEARAARQLAERLSAVLGLSSTLVRFRERERRAEQRAVELEADKARLELLLAAGARPRDALVEALAGAVRVANYSARARGTLELVERFAASGSDLALEVPVGTDALGWACAFHLAGPARGGPLVIVDAAAAQAQDEAHWQHPSESPLACARGGTLLVLNASALPEPAQDLLALGLSRRASAELHDPGFAFIATVAIPPQQLVDERQLSRGLARFLLPNTLRLPVLLERAEDLRALVLDRLCRSGIHHEGQPLGIEPQALSLLVDYAWPGNEAELRLVVERAARFATGPRVRIDDLALAGFDVSVPRAEARSVAPLRRARSETVRTMLDPEENRLERTTARRRRRR